jgi:hypothetical protein
MSGAPVLAAGNRGGGVRTRVIRGGGRGGRGGSIVPIKTEKSKTESEKKNVEGTGISFFLFQS